jgi:ATP-dependent RNA helicase DDX24/MAK5
MGNKRKTAATTASTDYALSAWKPVEVHLDGDASEIAPTNEEDETNATNNHYDNTKLSRKAKRDLPVNPGEDVAMFYGLEVLDASQYQLVQDGNTKRLVVINEEQKKMNQKEEETKNKSNESTTTTTAITKKAKKQKAKEESAAASTAAAAPSKKAKPTKGGNEAAADNDDKPEASEIEATAKPAKKKRKKKKKKPKKESLSNEEASSDALPTPSKGPLQEQEEEPQQQQHSEPLVDLEEKLQHTKQSWSQASGGAVLHSRLCESLVRLGFDNPTPIQAATLSAAVLGRRNLVGAAPTGSGKTLAFLLPILQSLLEQRTSSTTNHYDRFDAPRALIVTPTRELATQILSECDKLLPGQCVGLVGGIALVKQERILSTKRPPIVIGTPGRLWAMVRKQTDRHTRMQQTSIVVWGP